jgi:hypothetical protein
MSSLTILLLLTCAASAPDGITVESVLAALQSRSATIKDAVVRAHWQDFTNGQEVGWEEQRVFTDNFGRIRLQFKQGTISEDGTRQQDPSQPSSYDTLFDGEMLLDQRAFAGRDRLGGPTLSADSDSIYRHVQIFDAKDLGRGLADSQRNPLTFGVIDFSGRLAESRSAGRNITIAKVAGDQSLYSLAFERSPEMDPAGVAATVAIVDGGKGFLPLRIESTDESGRVIQRFELAYDRLEDSGIWVARRLSRQTFDPVASTVVPQSETRGVVDEIAINDPQFDESHFVAKLEPDTAVSDLRYRVDYRIGDEAVLSGQLDALAEEAKRRVPPVLPLVQPQQSRIVWIVWINLIALAVAGAVWAVRLRRAARCNPTGSRSL